MNKASSTSDNGANRQFGDLTNRDVRYASIVAFLAWMFAVYDYTIFGTLLPLMAKDFGWSQEFTGSVAAWVSVGVFAVSLTVGPMIDRLGRKATMVITTAGAALSSGLAGFAAGAVFLIIVRALSGFGFSEQAVNSAYLNELYASKRRGFLYSFVQGGWPIGVLFGAALTAILSPYLGWRAMFWVATFPAIIIVLLAVKLKESPHFRRLTEVRRLIRLGQPEQAQALGEKYAIATAQMGGSTFRQLFNSDLRRQTIMLMLAFLLSWTGQGVFIVLGTTVMTQGLNVSFGNSLLILIVSNLVTYAGYVLLGYLGDIVGRKLTIGASWLISSLMYTLMLLGKNSPVMVLIFYSAGLFFIIGPYSALFTYMGESFPGRVRGTGVALINAMGPLGALFGSALYTIYLTLGADIRLAAFLAGSIMVFLSGVVILMARTIKPGQSLEAITQ